MPNISFQPARHWRLVVLLTAMLGGGMSAAWGGQAAFPLAAAAGLPTPARGAKLSPQQILEKLFSLGAAVWVKKGASTEMSELKSSTDAPTEKFTFARVEFRAQKPDETPLVAADYAVLDSLADLPELALSGPAVTDAILEKLRPFRALRSLTLEEAKLSGLGYNVLPALPALTELQLRGTETNDAVMKTVTLCRKLKSLHLVTLPIDDDGLADLGKLPALEEVELTELDNLTPKGFVHLAECRLLRQVYATGFTILSGMVENIAHCKNLDAVLLPDSVLKDADVAPLVALTKLRTLDLSHSRVAGAVFAAWPARTQLTSLNLENAAGVNDPILKGLAQAFPKLEDLNLKLADSGFTVEGAASFRRLRSLQTLRLGGPGITDDVVAELVHSDGLATMAIPTAQITERGVASLARLAHLTELSIDTPPITDAALKSFRRCKGLKVFNIGKDAAPETESKLLGAVPGITIHRPEE